jgi:hypothetical protein
MNCSDELIIYLLFDSAVLVLAICVYLLMPRVFNVISNAQAHRDSDANVKIYKRKTTSVLRSFSAKVN